MELSRVTEVFYILIGELVTQEWTFIQISPDLGEAVKKKFLTNDLSDQADCPY